MQHNQVLVEQEQLIGAQQPKTSPFTAVSGDGFFVNTTSGGITVTLPSSPSAGDIVAFKDYADTWQTNSVTICRNGSKINGQCANGSLNTEELNQ